MLCSLLEFQYSGQHTSWYVNEDLQVLRVFIFWYRKISLDRKIYGMCFGAPRKMLANKCIQYKPGLIISTLLSLMSTLNPLHNLPAAYLNILNPAEEVEMGII